MVRTSSCRVGKPGLGVVGFRINGFQVRMLLPLPNPEDFRHYERKSGYSTRQVERAPEAAQKAYEQAERQAWRALLLVIKAKLEAVEAGITSIEQEFLPNMVLPDNTTVGENMLPRLREIVASGPSHSPGAANAVTGTSLGPRPRPHAHSRIGAANAVTGTSHIGPRPRRSDPTECSETGKGLGENC